MKKSLAFAAFLLWVMGSAFAADSARFLPQSFDGWQIVPDSIRTSADPGSADPTEAPVLKEYGFTGMEQATYKRDDGRTIKIRAARFKDATGGYGAFSYYVQPQMSIASVGDAGAFSNSRVLFYHDNILVDATLDHVTSGSASDLRNLSEKLPVVHGEDATLPALPSHVPKQSYIAHTARYIIGPVALERMGVPVPASLVDFSKSPEIEFANYQSSGGLAHATIIAYPTPQIAAERLRAIQAAHLPGGPFYFKRSGPLVALVNGEIPSSEAESLLASINYDAEVTWNQATKPNPRDNIGNLIVGVFMLIGILLVVALVLGFAFGGVRVIAKRLFPDRVFDRPEDVEIIRLNLH